MIKKLHLTIGKKNQSGVGLIEVLVAALVLAIGLVGLASLQIFSLKSTHSAYYRSVASLVAVDIEERLWVELADRGDLLGFDFENLSGVVEDEWNNACPTLVNACSLLPNLGIVIMEGALGDRSVWREADITVSWDENRFAGAGRETFEYRVRVPTGVVDL